ncbi:hypothetical protein Tco_0770281 [Tanacetum coccineum]|uniref:Transposase (Putative), gypsy type n=1 Tax=Tanacetum coccineum TaxID=301880 RepID=A0ABQ4ZC11_9ASTR
MSIDHSDQLHLPDAPDLDPSLEASVTPKFDMCLFRSTLTEKHVEKFSQIYAIPLELHPHAPPAGFTMDQLSDEHIGVNHSVIFEMYCHALNITPIVPLFRVFYKLCKQGNWFSFQSRVGKGLKPCIRGAPTSLKKWQDKYFLIDRRATPIAMSWRHHDSSVADVLPGPSEYNAAGVATLLEVSIQLHKPYNSLLYIAGLSPTWKGLGSVPIMKGPGGEVLTMAEFLRLPDLGACKIVAGALLPPNFPVDNYLTNPAARPEDIPPKTPTMEKAEVACQKVGSKRRVGQESASRKKKKAIDDGPVNSEPVFSPHPLHQAALNQPFVAQPVQESVLDARLDVLRNQTDELDLGHVQSFAHDGGGIHPADDVRGEEEQNNDQVVHDVAMREGRGQNDDQGVSPRPSVPQTGGEKTVSTGESSARNFGELPFTPVWGLTDSDRMVKFRQCRDMMSNIFTPADLAFFNEGMDDREAVRRSWKLLCQSSQQQANMLLRFERLYDESDKVQESCELAQSKYAGCKKRLADLQVAFDAKVSDYGQLSHDYEDALRREEALKVKVAELEAGKKSSDELVISQVEHIESLEVALKESEAGVEQLSSDREKFAVAAGQGEAIHKRLVTEYFPTFFQRLLQSNEYKESVGEVLSLAVGKGFIDGISLGQTKADMDALLKASPGVNPASSDLFMGKYLKLFEMHYPYMDKVTRAYFLDPSELQNVMPDGTGPTPGGGPRPSPTAHS